MQPYHRTNPAKRNSKLWKQEIAEAELSDVVDPIVCPACNSDKEKYYLGTINTRSYFRCDCCGRSICVEQHDPRSPVRFHEGIPPDSLLLQQESESFVRLLPVLRAGHPES